MLVKLQWHETSKIERDVLATSLDVPAQVPPSAIEVQSLSNLGH